MTATVVSTMRGVLSWCRRLAAPIQRVAPHLACGLLLVLALWLARPLATGAAGPPPSPIDRAWIAQGDCSAAASPCAWQAITLPDHWGIQKRRGTWTYRIQVPVHKVPDAGEPYAMWLPRAGDRLMVWLNGSPLARLGRIAHGQDQPSQLPLWIPVSPSLLHPGDNELRIVVSSTFGRLPGLSRVRWGPASAIMDDHQWRNMIVLGGAASTVIISVLAALAGAAVGWRSGHLHAWLFALCSAMWTVREVMRMQIDTWTDPVAWYAITVSAYGLTVMTGSWLQLLLMQIRVKWMYGPLWLVLLALPWSVFEAYLAPAQHVQIFTLWMLAAMAIGTVTALVACWNFVRHPGASQLMIALGCLGCVALSFTDNWMFFLSRNPMGYEHIPVTSYMGLSLILGISAAAFLRVERAMRIEAVHKSELERQVEAQRQELEALHAREQARIREQAVADERARLMRDMHDGLGSRLVGLMSTVQSGAFTRDELAQDLGEAMDELRLTLDSMSSAGEDLSSLLGQLRFRLAPRWRRLGIHLDWQVGELPTATSLGPSEMASLQRLLHEAFSNILKHAQASRVQVHAFTDAVQARHVIDIIDDGIGFDMSAPSRGHGLPNMQRRVVQLGGTLSIDASPGRGTRIRVELPAAPSPPALDAADAAQQA